MKNCEVLIGPIIDSTGVIRVETSAIVLDDAIADLFASWRFVAIISSAGVFIGD
jgi:hypothetical protein